MLDLGWDSEIYDNALTQTVISAVPGGPHDTADKESSTWLDNQSADMDRCQKPMWKVVEVYWGAKSNPSSLTQLQLMHQCYDKYGVRESQGMSEDEFEHMIMSPTYKPSSDEAQLCMLDPTGLGGWTLEQVAQMRAVDEASASPQPAVPASSTTISIGG
jgi:hypothetical protein